jgi:hypothetical protein
MRECRIMAFGVANAQPPMAVPSTADQLVEAKGLPLSAVIMVRPVLYEVAGGCASGTRKAR